MTNQQPRATDGDPTEDAFAELGITPAEHADNRGFPSADVDAVGRTIAPGLHDATIDPRDTVDTLPAVMTSMTPDQFKAWVASDGDMFVVYLPGQKSFVMKVPSEHNAFFVAILQQVKFALGPEVQAIRMSVVTGPPADINAGTAVAAPDWARPATPDEPVDSSQQTRPDTTAPCLIRSSGGRYCIHDANHDTIHVDEHGWTWRHDGEQAFGPDNLIETDCPEMDGCTIHDADGNRVDLENNPDGSCAGCGAPVDGIHERTCPVWRSHTDPTKPLCRGSNQDPVVGTLDAPAITGTCTVCNRRYPTTDTFGRIRPHTRPPMRDSDSHGF